MNKKRSKGFLDYLEEIIKFSVRFVFYIILAVYTIFKSAFIKTKSIVKSAKEKHEVKEIEKQREKMKAEYAGFNIVKTNKGKISDWENNFYKSDSKIGIILGARGSGKTAFGIKMLENSNVKASKKIYAIGFDENEMPDWIKIVDNVADIQNDSVVLIDEGGVLFSSRKAMTNANKMLTDLMLISRHKNISILFISQNSSNLDVNIIRQADFLVLKPSSLLQKDFERKVIGEIYDSTANDFKKYSDKKGLTYIYSDAFRGFVTSPLPSFWKISISKSFR